jgi:tetratricopeptide (TPR) repeat protein
VALDSSETLFTVLTAMNMCGYDQDLGMSDPIRGEVRAEVAQRMETDAGAKESADAFCQYFQQHRNPDDSKTLAQFVSLALFLGPPPGFAPKVKEAEMPPDVRPLAGLVPLLQPFYQNARLNESWQKQKESYGRLTARYHEPVSKMLFDTEIYLKLPSAGFLGRGFTVLVDPMGAPSQTNARIYSSDYFVVLSPGKNPSLKMDQIRHTYLHFLLDPLSLKYPATMKRLEPLLASVKSSPMDESFKTDSSLLVTECLIRAVEARMAKVGEAQREQIVQSSVEQGFILTRYFYEALQRFEKDAPGLRTAYVEIVGNIDVGREQKRAAEVQFASVADPELLSVGRSGSPRLLADAERKLSAGDVASAQKLAQKALDEKSEDPGRALFILAQVATASRDIDNAAKYFEQAIQVASEPKVVAWSHIYLGRIFDLQENRESALAQYRAALTASVALPEAKAAAERGLAAPYEPPNSARKQEEDQ